MGNEKIADSKIQIIAKKIIEKRIPSNQFKHKY